MIIYSKTKRGFYEDILSNEIDKIISDQILLKANRKTAKSEAGAFLESLTYMNTVLMDKDIPDDCGVAIEYHFPQTSKRADFIITGTDGKKENLIIIELKRWSEAFITSKDGLVETKFQGQRIVTSHPSYQAWSYAALLCAFNATVEKDAINIQPCAYLHNYRNDDIIKNDFYSYYLEKAPVFLKPDATKLQDFIKKHIKTGDHTNILDRIENSEIRPGKSLADSLRSMLKGNKEFILIDDQKEVYEEAIDLAKHSHEKNKNVLIIEGGPGTGKSVVAINLLIEFNRRGIFSQYVTKTSAPREVYFDKLRGVKQMTELKHLFVSSGSFMYASKNKIPVLIVDEAHRLTEKTSFLKRGDNQVREIINASLFSVFFIDEDQRVHIDDYATSQIIEDLAIEAGARVHKKSLASQFRCGGSDGYLSWIDDILQIRETANPTFDSKAFRYDFKVISSPNELHEIIRSKNKRNKARMVAGYCWDWISKKQPKAYDIVMPQHNFSMRWNLTSYGSTWIIDPNSVNEVGCIHTCQGLDVDYVGVIIGKDLVFRSGEIIADPTKRSKEDRSVFGYNKLLKKDPQAGNEILTAIIKNTYRTLMTRGMKGCYVYCEDKELEKYLRERLS